MAKIEDEACKIISICHEELSSQGFSDDAISYDVYLNMRYKGTDCALMCTGVRGKSDNSRFGTKFGDFEQTFLHK